MAKPTAPAPQNKSSTGSRPARRAASGSSPADSASRRRASPSIVDFYRESVSELRKVTWPTWQDASNLTLAVIGMTLAVAAFLGLTDEILNFIIKPIIGQ